MNLMLWIWSSCEEKKCIGDQCTSWGLASICQKEKSETKPSNAPVWPARLATSACELAPPDSAMIPNVIPKSVNVLNSLFSTFIFFFVLRFFLITRHLRTEWTFCISVENMPQMTSFVQVHSQAGVSFTQFKWQRMKFFKRNEGQIETWMTNGSGSQSIGSQNFYHPSVLAVVQTVTAGVATALVPVLILVLLFFFAQCCRLPQGFHWLTNEVLIKNSTAFICLGLHDKLTPVEETNVYVFSLHNRHSSVLSVPTATAAAMGVQTLLQIWHILRIGKRNVVVVPVESKQFMQTLSLHWRRKWRWQCDPWKLRHVIVLTHQFFTRSRKSANKWVRVFYQQLWPKVDHQTRELFIIFVDPSKQGEQRKGWLAIELQNPNETRWIEPKEDLWDISTKAICDQDKNSKEHGRLKKQERGPQWS
jgi:hypothetical protein